MTGIRELMQTQSIPMPVVSPITWEIERQGDKDFRQFGDMITLRYVLRVSGVPLTFVCQSLSGRMVADMPEGLASKIDGDCVAKLMHNFPDYLRQLVEAQHELERVKRQLVSANMRNDELKTLLATN